MSSDDQTRADVRKIIDKTMNHAVDFHLGYRGEEYGGTWLDALDRATDQVIEKARADERSRIATALLTPPALASSETRVDYDYLEIDHVDVPSADDLGFGDEL